MLGKTRFDRELLRDTFEHAVAACVPRGAGSQRLCLLLVAERTLGFDLRAAEPLRDQGQVRESVLREVNKRRTKAGLKPLSANPAADRAAQAHAEAMLEQGFYAHRAPDDGSSPKDRATREGLVPRVIAENIAKVVTTPEDVVARWMSSSAHRRNLLLRSATQHGLGVAVGIQDGEVVALWCQLIASP
jgi:uncharacterized protein YkwD